MVDDDSEPAYPPCEACPSEAASPALLERHFDAMARAAMPDALAGALAACARCLERTGAIDRAHVEDVMVALGRACFPLTGRFAEVARRARPDLAGAAVIVVEDGARIWDPRRVLSERMASLVSLQAPEVVVAPLRAELDARGDAPFEAEWHRVHAWPPPSGVADRSVAHAEIAKVLARAAMPRVGRTDALPAIEEAADHAHLDARGWALRADLAAHADPGARLAVRYLDELGHTDLRDDQDTLLDATHFALLAAGVPRGGDVHRTWLDQAVVAAFRRVRRQYATEKRS